MNEEQVSYVITQLTAGVDRSLLEQTLRENGYGEQLIRDLMTEADRRMNKPSEDTNVPPSPVVQDTEPQTEAAVAVDTNTVNTGSTQMSNAISGVPGVGGLIKNAFAIVHSRIDIYYWMLLIFALLAAGDVVVELIPEDSGNLGAQIAGVLLSVVSIFLKVMATAILAYGYVHTQDRYGVAEIFAWINKRIGSYIWISIILFLVIYGGLTLLIVPGVIAMVSVALVIPVFAAEDRRGMEALLRSRQLVKGRFGKTAGTMFLTSIISVALLILPIFISVIAALLSVGGLVAAGVTAVEGVPLWILLVVKAIFVPFVAYATAFGVAVSTSLYLSYSSVTAPAAEYKEGRTMYGVYAFVGLVIFPILFLVTASLNNSRDNVEDAMIKLNLSSARAEAELYKYDNDDSYLGFCTSPGLLEEVEGADCIDSVDAYRISVEIGEGEYFCVDSQGSLDDLNEEPTGLACGTETEELVTEDTVSCFIEETPEVSARRNELVLKQSEVFNQILEYKEQLSSTSSDFMSSLEDMEDETAAMDLYMEKYNEIQELTVEYGSVSAELSGLDMKSLRPGLVEGVYDTYCNMGAGDTDAQIPLNFSEDFRLSLLASTSPGTLICGLSNKEYDESELHLALYAVGYNEMLVGDFDTGVKFYNCAAEKYYSPEAMYRLAQLYKYGSSELTALTASTTGNPIQNHTDIEPDLDQSYFWVIALLWQSKLMELDYMNAGTGVGWNSIAMLDSLQQNNELSNQTLWDAEEEAIDFLTLKFPAVQELSSTSRMYYHSMRAIMEGMETGDITVTETDNSSIDISSDKSSLNY